MKRSEEAQKDMLHWLLRHVRQERLSLPFVTLNENHIFVFTKPSWDVSQILHRFSPRKTCCRGTRDRDGGPPGDAGEADGCEDQGSRSEAALDLVRRAVPRMGAEPPPMNETCYLPLGILPRLSGRQDQPEEDRC